MPSLKLEILEPEANAEGRNALAGFAATYLRQARTAMEWLHPALPRDGVPAIRRYGKEGRPMRFSSR